MEKKLKNNQNDKDIKKIIWKKWQDPYGENIEEIEWPGAFSEVDYPMSPLLNMKAIGATPFLSEEDDPNLNEDYDESFGSGNMETNSSSPAYFKRPIMSYITPMGIIPLVEQCLPSKTFNFWMGHSNFTITRELYEVIEKTDGVEILDIFTRYRIRIGIGQRFTDGNVFREINDNLYNTMNKNPSNNEQKVFNIFKNKKHN